ncbi:lysophospholipase L1-like esterase [Catenuloplanes nepalensis]|uniref:Lysophospholipase L1-like esterase n=1 Tax=Catenuloplanes nepalensis TaxID=587533 RepID=A0ABT9MVQ1_9ACTN|nr:SGNH/GDSL hydrolase family protein [Catenuloplanes nepalensis]MDP9795518.1 lysophospholipase L1-like esterase [Catenuloplanes nepalensis]
MRFLAIGDSFTEGVGDELPDGTVRGWADLVAAGLAAASGETVHYANLAVRGRLLAPIIGDQLEAALAMSPLPTLISLNGGGNDMLRRGMEVDHLMRLTERAVERCAAAGVRLLLISGPDPSDRLPFGRRIHRRGADLTVAVAELAARHGLPFANSFDDVEIRRPEYWSADRLHLNAAGHRRVAGIVLTALGHAVEDHRLDPAPAPARRLFAEARYYREHVLPFMQRRLRGQSSGDGRSAKYPSWTPVAAA